ncbi:MAG: hypothetical protein K9H65_05875 [Bacteroidales bacterium]|nr:hypothetical protein [Bacteroidales bacterium]
MIKAFFYIRMKQFIRTMKELGIVRMLFLLILFIFLVVAVFEYTSDSPHVYVTVLIYMAGIITIQLNRKDLAFLETRIHHYKRILIVEYMVLAIPLIAGLLYNHYYGMLILALVSVVLIPNIGKVPRVGIPNKLFLQWIPDDCFEWKAGIRKAFVWIVLIWTIGVATPFSLGTVPLAIVILGIIISGFYEYGEPLPMVLAFEKSNRRFLSHKITMHIKLFSVLSVPLICAFIAFHPDKWYIPVAAYLIFLSLHCYIILTKYAFYEPNTKSRASQTFGLIGILGVFIFLLLPVVWILAIYFYFKSKENLNFYLNDYY